MLRDEEIEAVMQETSNEIDTCTKALIQGALDLGGHDNVTVVLCQIVPEENKPSVQDMQQTVSTFTEKERKSHFGNLFFGRSLLFLFFFFFWHVWLGRFPQHGKTRLSNGMNKQ